MAGLSQNGAGLRLHGSVDQYCRVHGLDGLRVADASIIPYVTRANTNATAIMIGERLAGWIKAGS